MTPLGRSAPAGIRRWLNHGTMLVVLLSAAAWTAAPGEMPLPVDVQVSIFWRMWAFDRSHADRASDDLVVGIAYQPGYRASVLAREQFEASVRAIDRERGTRTRLVGVDVSRLDSLDVRLRRDRVDILYVAPVRAVDLRELTRVTRTRGVLTCTGVPGYMDLGVAVGVDVRGGRPQILVNLVSAREEGARFSSEILRRARLTEHLR